MEEGVEIEQSRYDSTASAIIQTANWRNWKKSSLPKITTEANFYPILGGFEPSSFLLLRISALDLIDEEINRTVQRIRDRSHSISLQKALNFVRELGSQTENLNIVAPFIPTMIIAAGMNTGDQSSFYDLFHSKLLAEKQEKKTIIVRLISYECSNIRNVIGTIFSQLLGIFPLPGYEQKKAKVSDFGLIVEWYKLYCEAEEKSYKRKRNQNGHPSPPKPPFVILFEDFDYFTGEVVEKLIFLCQRRRVEEDIPFLFFFSVACFGDSVKNKVEHQAFSHLRIETNQLPHAPVLLDAIVSEVFVKGITLTQGEGAKRGGCYFRLSSIAFSNAMEGFVQFHSSIGSFVESLREIVLYHFFTNPLSFYCVFSPNSPSLPPLTKEHLTHIRSLSSFRYILKRKKDKNGVEYTDDVISKLVNNDNFLRKKVCEWVSDIQTHLNSYWVGFQCLQALDSLLPKKFSRINAPVRSLYETFIDHVEFKHFFFEKFSILNNFSKFYLLLEKWKEVLEGEGMKSGKGKKGYEEDFRIACELQEELRKAENYEEMDSNDPNNSFHTQGLQPKGSKHAKKMMKALQNNETTGPPAKKAKTGGGGGRKGGGGGVKVELVNERCRVFVMNFLQTHLRPLHHFPLFEAFHGQVTDRSQNPQFIPEIVTRIQDPAFFLQIENDDFGKSDALEFQKAVFDMMIKKGRGTYHLSDWMSQFVEHLKKEAKKEKKGLENPKKKKGKKEEPDNPQKQQKHQQRKQLIEKFFETEGGIELLEHCFLWSIRTLNFLGFSQSSTSRPDHVELMGYTSVWRTGNVVLEEEKGRRGGE